MRNQLDKKLCVMTAYADETRSLLDVLGHDAGDLVDWNGRLQFAWCDGDALLDFHSPHNT